MEAKPFVESLREAIAASGFRLRGPRDSDSSQKTEPATEHAPETEPVKSVTITISIGVAENTTKRSTPELVLEAADGALYRAKESGRNCVRLADNVSSSSASS